jgi:G protein-coupled receptor GPR1
VPGSDGTFFGSFCFWRSCGTTKALIARRGSRAPSDVLTAHTEEGADREEKSSSQAGLLGALKRWSMSRHGSSFRGSEASAPASPATARPSTSMEHRRTRSKGSDRKKLEVERAHQRLALERADWEVKRKSFEARKEGALSAAGGQVQAMDAASLVGKEWWDRELEAASPYE